MSMNVDLITTINFIIVTKCLRSGSIRVKKPEGKDSEVASTTPPLGKGGGNHLTLIML